MSNFFSYYYYFFLLLKIISVFEKNEKPFLFHTVFVFKIVFQPSEILAKK